MAVCETRTFALIEWTLDCRTDCHRRSCSNWICMDIEVDRVLQAVGQRLKVGQASPACPVDDNDRFSEPVGNRNEQKLRRGGTWIQRWRVPLGISLRRSIFAARAPRPSTLWQAQWFPSLVYRCERGQRATSEKTTSSPSRVPTPTPAIRSISVVFSLVSASQLDPVAGFSGFCLPRCFLASIFR